MKNLIFIITLILILVGVMVFVFSRNNVEEPTVPPTPISTPRPTSSVSTPTPSTSPVLSPTPTQPQKTSKASVTYLDSGYSPSVITIKKDDIVYFENKSSKMMWTASAIHPTHAIYPGSNIEMCGTNTLVAIFDACKGYQLGEVWGFVFIHQGTWKYHNHLQPNHAGTVVVE